MHSSVKEEIVWFFVLFSISKVLKFQMITNLKKDYNAKRSQNLKFENVFL